MHMTFGRLGAVDRQAKMSGMEGALPATWRLPVMRWRLLADGLGLGVALYALTSMTAGAWHNDFYGFWRAWDGGLYDVPWLVTGAYVYSPAFEQAITPLTWLPFAVANSVWITVQLGALIWMLGLPLAAVALIFPWPTLPGYGNAVWATIANGNPQILLAAAIVLGLTRFPAAWSFVLLTKVTPGVGLLYYAIRREWRPLGIALTATLAIAAVSFIAAPDLWREWFGLLSTASHANTLTKEPILPLTFGQRLPIALLLIVVAAWRSWPWLLPLAGMFALPAIQLGGFAWWVGALALWRRRSADLREPEPRGVGGVANKVQGTARVLQRPYL
jgi:hypothetical protein